MTVVSVMALELLNHSVIVKIIQEIVMELAEVH